MILNLLLKTGGVLLLVLAAAHVFFPRRFGWKEDLAKLSLLNRQIFQVHCFFIVLVLVGFGLLNLFLTDQLLGSNLLAKSLLVGMAVFWFCRLIVQLFVYDSLLWKGNPMRTTFHALFVLFWSFLVVLYCVAFLQS